MDRPKLTHKVGDIEIKMTYGLSQDLQRVVPDPTNVMNAVLVDPFVRDYLVRRALTPTKGAVTDESELIAIDDVDLTPDEIVELLTWIAGHLLHFFAQSAEQMGKLGRAFEKMIPQPNPSTDGSPA